MYWACKIERPKENEADFYLFNSESEAVQFAASDIQDVILDMWDMADFDCATTAKKINDHLVKGNCLNAVDHWNDCDINNDSSYPIFYLVYEVPIKTNVPVPTLFDDSHFIALLDSEDPQTEVVKEAEEKTDSLEDGDGFVASDPGARCRGTHQEWNEYAYADRQDGTYLCQQCRMFRQVFGGIKKP